MNRVHTLLAALARIKAGGLPLSENYLRHLTHTLLQDQHALSNHSTITLKPPNHYATAKDLVIIRYSYSNLGCKDDSWVDATEAFCRDLEGLIKCREY